MRFVRGVALLGLFFLGLGFLFLKQKKRIILVKDTVVKPKVFYHASTNRMIDILEPRAQGRRDKHEGAVVFASPHISFASIWLSNHNDSWTSSGSFDGGPFFFLCKDKQRFLKQDKGGAIYVMPTDTFYCDLKRGVRHNEWVSLRPVKPLTKIEFDSALQAMLSFGVQVFFVDEKTFNDFWLTVKNFNPAQRRRIMMSLESENQKRGINPQPLFDYEKYRRYYVWQRHAVWCEKLWESVKSFWSSLQKKYG